MKYYIIEKEKGNLQIIKVLAVDDADFLEDYGQYILSSGNSLAEALQAFEKHLHEAGQ